MSPASLDPRPVLGIALRIGINKKSVWVGVAPPTPEEGQQGTDLAITVITRLYEGYLGVYGSQVDLENSIGYLLAVVPDQARMESYAELEKTGGSVVKLPEVIQLVRFYKAAPAEVAPPQPIILGMALRAFTQDGGGPFWFGKAYTKGTDPAECVNSLFTGARTAVPKLAASGAKLLLLSTAPTHPLLEEIEASAELAHAAVIDIMDETSLDVSWGPPVDGVH